MLPEPLTLSLIAAVFAAVLIGGGAHELTHWAIARLLSCSARFRLHNENVSILEPWFWDPHVEYDVPVTRGYWVERVVGLSPQLVGGLVGVSYVSTVGIPTGTFAPAVGLGWAIYTLHGGLEDYSVQAAHGDGIRDQPAAVRKLFWAAVLLFTGLVGGYYAHDVAAVLGAGERSHQALSFIIGEGSVSLLLISLLCLGLSVRKAGDIPESHPLRKPVSAWKP